MTTSHGESHMKSTEANPQGSRPMASALHGMAHQDTSKRGKKGEMDTPSWKKEGGKMCALSKGRSAHERVIVALLGYSHLFCSCYTISEEAI